MKKFKILLVALIASFAFSVNAQINVGATIGLQIPTGDFSEGTNMGFGFNATGKYMVTNDIAVGLNIGFNSFKFEGGGDASLSIIPITGLFEYHFDMGKYIPYIGADLGFYSTKVKIGSGSNSETNFGFAPTAGVLYPINDKLSFLGNMKFHLVTSEGSNLTFFGINAGISYKIK